MKTVRKFSFRKFLLFLLLVFVVIVVICFGVYKFETGAVSSNKDVKLITIEKGENFYNISDKLKKNNLIKSEMFYKLYLKLRRPGGITAGDYELNESMGVKKIVDVLSDKKNQKIDNVTLTIKEGLNIRDIAFLIEDKSDISASDFISKMENRDYVKTLQADYSFLSDEIFSEGIYYPLEGYLYPDTYIFERKKIDIDSIVRSMLDEFGKNVLKSSDLIKSSGHSLHQILTMASLTEKEATTDEDRAMVAGVFYKRLSANMSLGSDVTTYYSAKKSLKDKLTSAELSECNGYNTRCRTMKGLPVGPINNPSLSSVNAVLNYTPSDYYYFVADSSGKVYFTKTLNEHNAIISKLKSEGKWVA